MRKLRLRREPLPDLGPGDLARLRGGVAPTEDCPASNGQARCVTLNGCPWTGQPCLFTAPPPPTFHTCG